jgi:hypothetical protein
VLCEGTNDFMEVQKDNRRVCQKSIQTRKDTT